MFVGLKSMARRLERLEMKLAKHNPASVFRMTNWLSRATIIPALYQTTNRPNFKPRSAEQGCCASVGLNNDNNMMAKLFE